MLYESREANAFFVANVPVVPNATSESILGGYELYQATMFREWGLPPTIWVRIHLEMGTGAPLVLRMVYLPVPRRFV